MFRSGVTETERDTTREQRVLPVPLGTTCAADSTPDALALPERRGVLERVDAAGTPRDDGLDPYMLEQAREAPVRRVAESMPYPTAHAAMPGAGTGWLGATLTAYGPVTATDLVHRPKYPGDHLRVGSVRHRGPQRPLRPDRQRRRSPACPTNRPSLDKVASLLRPGGVLLLMTQNASVWNRSQLPAAQGRGPPLASAVP